MIQIDSWMDDGEKACIVIEGQFFNAEVGSILCEETDPEGDWIEDRGEWNDDPTVFMVNLPMENKTYFCLWLFESGRSTVQLYHQEPSEKVPNLIDIPCLIKEGVIRPTPRGGETEEERMLSSVFVQPWEQDIQTANDLRQLLVQIGRMEVKP